MSNGITDLVGRPDPTRRRTVLASLNLLPLNIRQLGADVTGKFLRERLGLERLGNLVGSRDINENDLSQAEYSALQDLALKAIGGEPGRGGVLSYKDYGTSEIPRGDVGGGVLTPSDAVRKLFDPNYILKTTLGQAVIEFDPTTGDHYVVDQYNFNDRLPEKTGFGGFLDSLRRRRAGKQGVYGIPRAIGEAFGSPEGEGSPVRINLGTLGPPEPDERGRIYEGINKLRNMFSKTETPRSTRSDGNAELERLIMKARAGDAERERLVRSLRP